MVIRCQHPPPLPAVTEVPLQRTHMQGSWCQQDCQEARTGEPAEGKRHGNVRHLPGEQGSDVLLRGQGVDLQKVSLCPTCRGVA